MWKLCVAAAAVVTIAAVGQEVPQGQLAVSWCPDSPVKNPGNESLLSVGLDNLEVVVNNTFQYDVIDKVYMTEEPRCTYKERLKLVHLDGAQGMLMLQERKIVLLWRSRDTLHIFQEIQNFCVAVNSGETDDLAPPFSAKFCYKAPGEQVVEDFDFCSSAVCVRKCCPSGRMLSQAKLCMPVEEGMDWQPSFITSEDSPPPSDVRFLYGPPPFCDLAVMYDEFSIEPSGVVVLEGRSVTYDGYCIDTFLESPSNPMALVCQNEQPMRWYCEFKQFVLQPVLQGLSCVCLALTWLVYVSVAQLRIRNMVGCLLSFVSALFVTFLIFIILNFKISFDCIVAGRVCHLTTLATFFWLNVLSYHTFNELRSESAGQLERQRVFLLYSLYAWGCPLLLTLVGLILDVAEVDTVRPRIGEGSCWINGTNALWAYLYGPMLVLLLINVGFFVGCVVLLKRRSKWVKEQGRARDPVIHHQTFSVWVCVKLFILMGILWLMEVLAWLFFESCSIPAWVFDIITSLNGVFVFLVTVCFRKDLKVFHCGRPQLIPGKKYGDITSGEASELVGEAAVK